MTVSRIVYDIASMTPSQALPESVFSNEPFCDFQDPATAASMRKALADVAVQLGQHYPLEIPGRPVKTGQTIVSVNPSSPPQIIGEHDAADASDAAPAVAAAAAAWPAWSMKPMLISRALRLESWHLPSGSTDKSARLARV